MKRVGNIYSKIYDMENLRLAHKNARRGKGWYEEVKRVDANLDYYLNKLQKQLINHTYKTSKYTTFIKHDSGKDREIYRLPYFPDRICQWAILQVIGDYILRNLTSNTYSAIPNRGIHYGYKKMQKDIQSNKEKCKYCLKIDARKYYPSINHDILKSKYRSIFKDKELLWLLDEIIDSTEGDTGIPIGNYLSQFSGNFYLSSFDHWIKEEKHVDSYHRYMDDIVIFAETKEELYLLRIEIDKYFREKLKLEMKDNWQIFPTFVRGVDFLGYRFFGDYTLLRKSTLKRMKRALIPIHKKVSKGNMINYHEWCQIDSYKGWLKWCDSFNLYRKYILPLENACDSYYTNVIKRKVCIT